MASSFNQEQSDELIKKLQDVKKIVRDNPEKARKVLFDAGIIDVDGKLMPQYQSNSSPDNKQNMRDLIAEWNEEALFADGFDEALIGVATRCGMPCVACYDADKCIEILINGDEMTHEEAVEYFEFNTLGAYVGGNTPIYVYKLENETF